MRSVRIVAPGSTAWAEIPRPAPGPTDVLVRIRACGICGSDAMYTRVGGFGPYRGAMALGHEPAGEVVEVGAGVHAFEVGDHVVMNVLAMTDGLLGSGGAQGALTEYVLVRDAAPGVQLKTVPATVPWEVAALNEPMAVALHAVNRTSPRPGDQVVVFGAGPIGLGAVLAYRRREVRSIVVVAPSRLDTALAVGADEVIDSNREDVAARLVDLHGDASGHGLRGHRPGTDIYLDAAGAAAVPQSVGAMAKHGATLGIVATYTDPVQLDFSAFLSTELTIVWSVAYPTEIFEVTDHLVEHWERYAPIVTETAPFEDSLDALARAARPGSGKIVVRFD